MNWLSGRLIGLICLIAILVTVLVNHSKKGTVPAGAPSEQPLEEEVALLHDMTVVAKSTRSTQPAPAAADEEFFPENPQTLQKEIQKLLGGAPSDKKVGNIAAVVVPHAGIKYSGKVAANAFALLKEQKFDTVVILAPNHKDAESPSVVICPKGKLLTPIGKVEVDEQLALQLSRESSEFVFDAKPFSGEHAVEVQLPFLQTTLKDFKVLPVLLSGRSTERCARLADALMRSIGKRKVLFIATTHLSTGESHEKTKRLDFLVTSVLERCDSETLLRYENEGLVRICGYAPVMTLFYVLKEKGIEQGKMLDYANSADVTGEKSGRVVGYAAMAYIQS